MSSPQGSLRQRNVAGSSKKKTGAAGADTDTNTDVNAVVRSAPAQKAGSNSEWSYRIAFVAITALAFLTRFWGISHPNEVVFDEVHFGKVSEQLCPSLSSLTLL